MFNHIGNRIPSQSAPTDEAEPRATQTRSLPGELPPPYEPPPPYELRDSAARQRPTRDETRIMLGSVGLFQIGGTVTYIDRDARKSKSPKEVVRNAQGKYGSLCRAVEAVKSTGIPEHIDEIQAIKVQAKAQMQRIEAQLDGAGRVSKEILAEATSTYRALRKLAERAEKLRDRS